MTNLFDETMAVLEKNGKTFYDIDYIGSKETKINTEEALEIMQKTNYDNDFGRTEIATNLIIVGKGFIMTRGGDDGSEWWDYMQTKPHLQQIETKIERLITNDIGGRSLEQMNKLRG